MYSMVLFSYAPPQFWPLGSPKSQFCQKQLLLAALGLELELRNRKVGKSLKIGKNRKNRI